MFWWHTKLWLGIILIAHSVFGHLGYSGFMAQPRSIFPITLICIGGLTNLYHYWLIKRINNDISRPHTLIDSRGLYPYCRHPMYLCDIVMYLGIATYPVSSVSIVLFIVLVPVIVFLAQFEDSALEHRFPEQFKKWRVSSGLLIPKI